MLEMFKMIVQMPIPFNMIVLVTMSAFAFTSIVSIAQAASKYFCYREELDFKRDMIAQGMSVDEVDRLARSGKPKDNVSKSFAHAPSRCT